MRFFFFFCSASDAQLHLCVFILFDDSKYWKWVVGLSDCKVGSSIYMVKNHCLGGCFVVTRLDLKAGFGRISTIFVWVRFFFEKLGLNSWACVQPIFQRHILC